MLGEGGESEREWRKKAKPQEGKTAERCLRLPPCVQQEELLFIMDLCEYYYYYYSLEQYLLTLTHLFINPVRELLRKVHLLLLLPSFQKDLPFVTS